MKYTIDDNVGLGCQNPTAKLHVWPTKEECTITSCDTYEYCKQVGFMTSICDKWRELAETKAELNEILKPEDA